MKLEPIKKIVDVEELKEESFEQPILLFVSGEWLGSTNMLKVVIRKTLRQLNCNITTKEFCFKNQKNKIAGQFNLPKLYLIKNGKFITSHSGILPSHQLKQLLTKHL